MRAFDVKCKLVASLYTCFVAASHQKTRLKLDNAIFEDNSDAFEKYKKFRLLSKKPVYNIQ